ncbi:hypothetical protein SUGI_0809500 [Cryptomeria japonica]|nr:hypothetical protein SUGI_0809500 [Cryptomeria japonica]
MLFLSGSRFLFSHAGGEFLFHKYKSFLYRNWKFLKRGSGDFGRNFSAEEFVLLKSIACGVQGGFVGACDRTAKPFSFCFIYQRFGAWRRNFSGLFIRDLELLSAKIMYRNI